MNKPLQFDRDRIMTESEAIKLIESLLVDVNYQPYAVYGLMFLFASIKNAVELGGEKGGIYLEDMYSNALIYLYSVSANATAAADRMAENIHLAYRRADFTNRNQNEASAEFVKIEFFCERGGAGGRQWRTLISLKHSAKKF